MKEVYEATVKMIKDSRNSYISLAKEALFDALKIFFETYPEFIVSWTQYTPYFNDGDPCTFSVNNPELFVSEDDFHSFDGFESWSFYEGRFLEECPNLGVEVWSDWKDLADFMAEIPDQIYEEIFDNHVRVVASKEGFLVESYDHD
jgi:hypothetical protein